MTIKEYQRECLRTFPLLENVEIDILHMRLGMLSEFGEIADIFKKNIAYKKPIDLVHLGEEIGDACWYMANMANIHNIELNDFEVVERVLEVSLEEVLKTVNGLDIANIFSVIDFYDTVDKTYLEEIYCALLIIAFYYQLEMSVVLQTNIDKLKIRYPEKFTTDQALNRDLNKERKQLEDGIQGKGK